MKTRFVCPNCGNAVTLHVNTSVPPTCYNPKKHSGKRVEMEAAHQEEKGNSRQAANKS
jgi:hypothetical protein